MLDEMEAQEVTNAVNDGSAVRMKYNGEPTMTRGDNGESVQFGYAVNGYVYVWDSTYGWFLWSSVESAPFTVA